VDYKITSEYIPRDERVTRCQKQHRRLLSSPRQNVHHHLLANVEGQGLMMTMLARADEVEDKFSYCDRFPGN
jgi:hypothetical protein